MIKNRWTANNTSGSGFGAKTCREDAGGEE